MYLSWQETQGFWIMGQINYLLTGHLSACSPWPSSLKDNVMRVWRLCTCKGTCTTRQEPGIDACIRSGMSY